MIGRLIRRIRSDTAQITLLLEFGDNPAAFGLQMMGVDVRLAAQRLSAAALAERERLGRLPLGDRPVFGAYWEDFYNDMVTMLGPYRGRDTESLPTEVALSFEAIMSFFAFSLAYPFQHRDIISLHTGNDRNLTLRVINSDKLERRLSRRIGNPFEEAQLRREAFERISKLPKR